VLARAKRGVEAWRLMVQVATLCGHARRSARQAPASSTVQLVSIGLYAGLLDGAERLQIGSWGLARRLFPIPPAAPSEVTKLHAYLAGYFEGEVLLALADRAWRRGDDPWDGARMRISARYATTIASPEGQAKLLMPTEKAVVTVHHIACAVTAKGPDPLDWQTELDLFRWLAARSGLETSRALEERLLRQRIKRQQLAEPPAA
jgi:hypothetical protein